MRYTLLFLAWLSFMSYGLFRPGGGETHLFFPGDDKLIHFGLFLGMSLLLMAAAKKDWSLKISNSVLLAVFFGFCFAIGSEWIQQFIPRRASDYKDTLFDLVGVFLAIPAFLFLEKRKQTSRK